MDNFDINNITLKDLRVIINSLKLSGLSFIEPEAVDQISILIKNLPSTEYLDSISGNDREVKRIMAQLGYIMRQIGIYSNKSFEYKTRHKSVKKMPPRYKIIEWKKANISKKYLLLKISNKSVWDESYGVKYSNIISEINTNLQGLKKYIDNLIAGTNTDSVEFLLDKMVNILDRCIMDFENFKNESSNVFNQVNSIGENINKGTITNKSFTVRNKIINVAYTPVVLSPTGEQLIGGKSVWKNTIELADHIKSILAKDSWNINVFNEILNIVKELSNKMQSLKDITSNLAALNIPDITSFMDSQLEDLTKLVGVWNTFISEFNNDSKQLNRIQDSKDEMIKFLGNQGIVVNR